jgi:nitrous oxidase accessory protein
MSKSTTQIFYSLGLSALLVASFDSAAAQTIVVDPQGDVQTVSQALEMASDGFEIIITAGIYQEPTLVVDKSVSLIGRGEAVLDGQGDRQIMTVTAPDVRISGLILRNVGVSFIEDRAAIKVEETAHCIIEDNRIENTFFAIYLAQTSGCEIRRNTIVGTRGSETHSANGIHLWYSVDAIIEDNHITGHRDGLYFEFVERAVVSRNVSEHNLRYGLHFMFSDDCTYTDNVFRKNNAGVAVMYTENVSMIGNRFEANWGSAAYGLLLKDITDSEVIGNTFDANTVGIHLEGSNRITVTDNHFWRNGWAVRVMANCLDVLFAQNNFGGNTFDVSTNGRTIDTRFVENYWDHYEGYDLDRDGYGDVPFRPVSLFSMIVEQNEPSLILLHSLFVRLLDAAERMLPAITPVTIADEKPRMRRFS